MEAPAESLPRDEHNTRLLSHVRPQDWRNPEPKSRYNLVVVGGGTAGLVSAAGAAMLGARVALVERDLMGGDCLNTGCVPSKAVIRSGRAAAAQSSGERFGVRDLGHRVDFAAVMERMRSVRARIGEHDSVERFRKIGVEIFLGAGRFVGHDTLEVGGSRLRFRRAVIASGARAVAPPIEGLAEAGYLTHENVFNLSELPRRLMVVGGGPIGVELAQTFARLGSEVTVVEMLPRLLPLEDPDAAVVLRRALERDGVRLRVGTRVEKVTIGPQGKEVRLRRDGGADRVTVDALLIGVGRAANVEDLGLEQAGVSYEIGRGVSVDDHLRTTNRRIFAAGDVCLRHKFTHTADASARIVLQNALFRLRRKLSALTVPWCTYTSPEVAHVGLYEHEASERGIEIDTYTVPMSDVDRTIVDGAEDGFVKIHVRKGGDRIVGATIVAENAGDLISELTLAMVARIGLGKISSVIHPYPTYAEAIKKAADAYNRQRMTPRARAVLKRWFRWNR